MPKSRVEPGYISGRLTVLEKAGVDKQRDTQWLCKCTCGNEVIVAGRSLASRGTSSCGCLRWDNKVKIGDRFGRLKVLSLNGRGSRGDILWDCLCECGNISVVASSSLTRGHTNSCGCYAIDKIKEASTKHGMYKSKIYSVWQGMKARCDNKDNIEYKNYGERGIAVCEEWRTFTNFLMWAKSSGYSEELSIDRIDVNKGYSPENCRWATIKEQNNNKRNTVLIKGEPLVYVLEDLGITDELDQSAIRMRVQQLGWDIDSALNTPIERRVPRNNKIKRNKDAPVNP